MFSSVNASESGFRPGVRFRRGSSLLGSVDAPEPGFRPGVRWGVFARWGPVFVLVCGPRFSSWRAEGSLGSCAHDLDRLAFPSWRAPGVPVRRSLAIDAVALALGVVLRFACCPGLPVCGAARGGERHVLLRSYVVGVHWVRAYACVALGEWRTDAASEEVYVGAGGGIASVA